MDIITVKKIAISLMVIMLLSSAMIPVMNQMSEGAGEIIFEDGSFCYTTITDRPGEVQITDLVVEGIQKDAVIPSEVEHDGQTYTVSSIVASFVGSGIETIHIPSTIAEIGPLMLSDIATLKMIWVDSQNQSYSSEHGVLFDKDKTELIQYPIGNGKDSYVVPNTVSKIDSYAFKGSQTLSRLFMQGGLTEIGMYAFSGCTQISEITFPTGITQIDSTAFQNILFYNTDGETQIGKTAENLGGHSFISTDGRLVMTQNAFNVFYDTNGGTGMASAYTTDESIVLSAPEGQGNFIGWECNGVLYQSGSQIQVGQGIGLTAYWSDATLTINPNIEGQPSSQNGVVIGEPFGLYVDLSAPVREGYTFTGWFDENGNRIDGNTICTGDCTATAVWVANTYTITFDANGGTVETTTKTVTYDEAYGELPVPTRFGYNFIGWFDDIGEGMQIIDTDICTVPSDQTFYAHWTQLPVCTIIFDGNGGTSPESINIIIGDTYGELPTSERDGYEFVGWFSEKEGGTMITPDMICTTENSQTLYAHWVPNDCVITFDADGGKVEPQTKIVGYDMPYGKLPTPTKDGCDFRGWYDGNGNRVDENTVCKGDTTLHAHWESVANNDSLPLIIIAVVIIGIISAVVVSAYYYPKN